MLYRNVELRQMVVADVREEALRLAQLAATDQQDSIRDTRQLLFALAQLPVVRNGEPVACSAFFTRLFAVVLGMVIPNSLGRGERWVVHACSGDRKIVVSKII
jgi:hypothetical protein